MKKFVIIEKVPATVVYTYEVEAENEEQAMEKVQNYEVDATQFITEMMDDDSEFELLKD